jgi:F-type H+-transporting ATPase subunit b
MTIIKKIHMHHPSVSHCKIGKKTIRPTDTGKWHSKEMTLIVVANIFMALPAHAGKVFDFNATLPAMAAQFLLLMFFLDKIWFSPVGKVLDERDAQIRARLNSVKSGSDEKEALQNEADTLLKDARNEAQSKIADAKRKAVGKAEAELAAEKSKLDAELTRAVKDIEADRMSAQDDIDEQVAKLSEYIVKRVLPSGLSL